MNKLLGVLLLMFISTSCFSWTVFGPKNYDECILENMKGVSSDSATMLIENSCREKFTEKEVVSSPKHNWTQISSTINSTLYMDKSTKTRHGNIVTSYILDDSDKIEITESGVQYYSRIYQLEVDCDVSKVRFLKCEFKSGHMGDGDIMKTSGVTSETGVPKESVFYTSFCNN